HLVPGVEQVRRDGAADVPGAAGDEVLPAAGPSGTLRDRCGHAPLATSRSRPAAASGRTSLTKAPIPDSDPARYLSLPGLRRMVNSSRWSAKSSRVSSARENGAWCQPEIYGVRG